MECDEGPVGMLEVVGRVPVHRRVLALDDLYPTGRDFAMGYLQSKLVVCGDNDEKTLVQCGL